MKGTRPGRTEELVTRILERKAEIRSYMWNMIVAKHNACRAKGKVFLRGVWVPKVAAARIEECFLRKRKRILLEMHLVIAAVLMVDYIVWKVFNIFLLPK